MNLRSKSIKPLVLLFSFVFGLSVLLPVGGVLLYTHISQFKAKLSQSFQATARVIATNASAALAFEDRTAAKELLASLVNDPSISAAALYDKEDDRFVFYGTPPLTPPAITATDGFSTVRVEVAYKGERYGSLFLISRYPAELAHTVRIWGLVYVGGLIGAILIALYVGRLFQRTIASPLQSLARIAGDVTSHKNYEARVALKGPAEIMELADAFNTMLEEIGRRDAELAEKNETLALQLDTLRENNREMMRLSRDAGMAEIATGVLHNIGNALNSINVSTEMLFSHVREHALATTSALRGFFENPPEGAAPVFSTHPRGGEVQNFALSLSVLSVTQLKDAERELLALRTSVAHLKDIVARQQSFAKITSNPELFDVREAINDALLLNKREVQQTDVRIIQDRGESPVVYADRNYVVQILINLISNAHAATEQAGVAPQIIEIKIGPPTARHLPIAVTDNGCGIPAHQLVSIFSYGFTTKVEGHGFGLHNSANAARLMGGSLQVQSPGPGSGATFTLNIPLHSPSLHDA